VVQVMPALSLPVAVQLVLQRGRVAPFCGSRLIAVERQFGAPNSVRIFNQACDRRTPYGYLMNVLNARLRVRIWYIDVPNVGRGDRGREAERRLEVQRRLAAAAAAAASARAATLARV
jgi:hypothetical protein